MRCPHCGRTIKGATDKQLEAFRLWKVYGLSHAEIGAMEGVTRSAISHRLLALRRRHPDLLLKQVNG